MTGLLYTRVVKNWFHVSVEMSGKFMNISMQDFSAAAMFCLFLFGGLSRP